MSILFHTNWILLYIWQLFQVWDSVAILAGQTLGKRLCPAKNKYVYVFRNWAWISLDVRRAIIDFKTSEAVSSKGGLQQNPLEFQLNKQTKVFFLFLIYYFVRYRNKQSSIEKLLQCSEARLLCLWFVTGKAECFGIYN